MSDKLDQLIADAAACLDCGKEHELRDVSRPGRTDIHGPVKEYSWADPVDGHPYRHATIDVAWLRRWRRERT